MNRLNELSSNETSKQNSQDYRLQRRYELYETNINGKQKRMFKHKGTDLLYVCNVEPFVVIHAEHLPLLIMEQETERTVCQCHKGNNSS